MGKVWEIVVEEMRQTKGKCRSNEDNVRGRGRGGEEMRKPRAGIEVISVSSEGKNKKLGGGKLSSP